MRTFKGRRSYSEGRSGQATIEYVFLLAITTALVVLVSNKVIEVMDDGVVRFGGALEKQLKTGRANISVWKN